VNRPRPYTFETQSAFVDALRACLGLGPLYGDGLSKQTDEERFAAAPYELPTDDRRFWPSNVGSRMRAKTMGHR